MPLVSVIMSVYNGERYVGSAIESILAQTFTDFEFIIIDDGSRDNTARIIEGYQNKDPRIIFLQNRKNIGLVASLNAGIQHSTGQFIARQDADDISLSDRLKKQIEFFQNYKEYYLLGTAFLEIDGFGKVICKQRTPLFANDSEIRKNIVKFNPFCHGSVMFKKEAMDKVGKYNEDYLYAQDYELWIRIMKYYKAANLKDILLYRRVTKKMASLYNLKRQSINAIKVKVSIIKSFNLSLVNYVYLIKDVIRLILPTGFVRFLRFIKRV